MSKQLLTLVCLGVVAILAGCGGGGDDQAATQEDVAMTPVPLLDRELFFGDPEISGPQLSPDGRWIALAGGRPSENGGVELRGWPSGELVWSSVTRDDLVYSVVWSPDSRQVFASGHDARIIARDAETGTTVRVLEGHSRPVLAACVTQDGATIVSAGMTGVYFSPSPSFS